MDEQYLQWKQWEGAEFGRCSEQARRYYSWHVHRAFAKLPAPLNVLELGFGNGQFLAYCRSRGFAVTGLDINAHLLDRAKAAGFATVRSIDDALAAGPFDLVVAFDVLEHFDSAQVEQLFKALRMLLSENGRLIARVPNGDSPFGRRHQHGDLTHLTTFGEFKFRQLAQMWGLSLVATGEAPWYIDEFEHLSIKSPLRGLLKAVIEIGLGFAFYRKWVSLDPNLVVVLKKASRA